MTTIKQRRGTAAQWSTANPVLAAGEPGFETDTGNHKVGDGTTAWNSLKTTNSATYVPLALQSLVQVPAAAADVFGTKFYRNATYAGGAAGFVNTALRVQTDVAAGVTDYEWGFLSQLNNSSAAGENTAGYHQALRQTATTGPTWATVSEAIDNSGAASPTVGLIGHEVDIRANGADANHQRVGIDIVATNPGAGTVPTVWAGIRLSPASTGTYTNGLLIAAATSVGISIPGTSATGISITGASANRSIAVDNASQVGLDLSVGVFSTAAIRLARQQAILWEGTGVYASAANAGGGDFAIVYTKSGVEKVGLDLDTAAVRINGTNVVGARQGGWTAATGTATRTTFATGTVTLSVLAEHVKALTDDLLTHGLIGA